MSLGAVFLWFLADLRFEITLIAGPAGLLRVPLEGFGLNLCTALRDKECATDPSSYVQNTVAPPTSTTTVLRELFRVDLPD